MSQWQGFDSRKICPNCGGYETRLHKYEKKPISFEMALLVLLSLTIAIAVTGFLVFIFIGQIVKGHPLLLGFVLPFLFIVGNLLFNRGLKAGLAECYEIVAARNSSAGRINPASQWSGYHLYCWKCGFEWEIATEDWEKAGQHEVSQGK
jgi:hypothetical protein